MDNLPDEAASAFENAHSVFCTLGTTRKVGHIEAVASPELLCNFELLQGMMHNCLYPADYFNCRLLHNLMVTLQFFFDSTYGGLNQAVQDTPWV